MTHVIRIAIIDDHPLFREGVARSLADFGGFEVVGEGASAEDAERLVKGRRPDIVLLDISMPGGGSAAVARILAADPQQKIVILTVSEANADLTMALNAGVRGYVLKGVGSKALADILRAVAAGEGYVAPNLSARLLSDLLQLGNRQADPIERLNGREADILQLVAEGLSNKEVAGRLALHEKTIKQHMTRILSKLNVRNRTEAALLIHEAKRRTG